MNTFHNRMLRILFVCFGIGALVAGLAWAQGEGKFPYSKRYLYYAADFAQWDFPYGTTQALGTTYFRPQVDAAPGPSDANLNTAYYIRQGFELFGNLTENSVDFTIDSTSPLSLIQTTAGSVKLQLNPASTSPVTAGTALVSLKSTVGIVPGMSFFGSGIASGALVKQVLDANTVLLDTNAAASSAAGSYEAAPRFLEPALATQASVVATDAQNTVRLTSLANLSLLTPGMQVRVSNGATSYFPSDTFIVGTSAAGPPFLVYLSRNWTVAPTVAGVLQAWTSGTPSLRVTGVQTAAAPETILSAPLANGDLFISVSSTDGWGPGMVIYGPPEFGTNYKVTVRSVVAPIPPTPGRIFFQQQLLSRTVAAAGVSNSRIIPLDSSNNWEVGFEVFNGAGAKIGTIQSVDSDVQVTLGLGEDVTLLPGVSLSAGPVSPAFAWRSVNSLPAGTKIYGGLLTVDHNVNAIVSGVVVSEGMTVYGPGLASNTVVNSVLGFTQFTLNKPPLTGTSYPPLILTKYNEPILGTVFTGSSVASPRNGFGLGMTVTGPGIPAGAFVSSFSDTSISLSLPVATSSANNQEIRLSYSPFFPRMNNVSMELGSKAISYVSRDSGVAVGMLVVGEGIPPGTTVASCLVRGLRF